MGPDPDRRGYRLPAQGRTRWRSRASPARAGPPVRAADRYSDWLARRSGPTPGGGSVHTRSGRHRAAAGDPRVHGDSGGCPEGPAPQGECAVNGLPVQMIDRWQDRAEAAPGEGLIYWHMLVGTDPGVIALVREAR